MANTYTQIHIHAVFAVQNRLSLITESWRNRLYNYIAAIIQNHEHKLLAINGMPDHVHILFGMRPIQSLSDLMQDIKSDSSRWINENRLVAGRFSWQAGYGAFSYSKLQIPSVIRYIKNQEQHHRQKTMREEFEDLLIFHGILYDTKYILKDIK
jgi:REP element-mobilizing transposase RayT